MVDYMMWYGCVRSGGLYFFIFIFYLSISLPSPAASGKYSDTVISQDGGMWGKRGARRVCLWDVVSRNPGTY